MNALISKSFILLLLIINHISMQIIYMYVYIPKCRIHQNIKISIIVVELIKDNTDNSFCRTLESHDLSSMMNILCRYIMNCCQIYFTTLLNISPFCHQNTLLLLLAWCYTSCVCHPTIKLIGHTFI